MSRNFRLAIPAFALFASSFFMSGCTQLKGMMFGRTPEYMDNVIDPMPSEWANAPAENYRYYANAEVYFSEDRSLYFWRNEEGNWEQGSSLPSHVIIEDARDFQKVALHFEDPTLFHDSFARAFPAEGQPFLHSQSEAIATVTSNEWPEN